MNKEKILIKKGDITKLDVDVIVNAANAYLIPGGGVDGAIHKAGGKEIVKETKKYIDEYGILEIGAVTDSTAGKLLAKKIYHTVGPIYKEGLEIQNKQLKDCYINSIKKASVQGYKTIAFPCISTGVYGFPKEKAAIIAINAVDEALSSYPSINKVILISFDDYNYKLYCDLYNSF